MLNKVALARSIVEVTFVTFVLVAVALILNKGTTDIGAWMLFGAMVSFDFFTVVWWIRLLYRQHTGYYDL